MSIFFPTISHTKSENLKKWVNNDAVSDEMKFQILLPLDGLILKQENDFPTSEKPLIDCIFFENKKLELQVIVQCMFIDSEVSLQHYLEYFSIKGDEKIIEQRCINDDTDKPDMLISQNFADGQIWITRRTAYKRWAGGGAYVLIANVATKQQLYKQHANLLFIISNSLRSNDKQEYDKAERLKLITKKYPVDFATYLPLSWENLYHHNDTMQQMNLSYTKKIRGKITGIFSISTRTRTEEYFEMNDVLREVHKPYRDLGVNMDSLALAKSDNISGLTNLMKGSIDFEEDLTNGKKKNNISFYIGKIKNAWLYSEIFGPSKETDFESWAINNRAMEIANQNMQMT